MMTTVDKYIPPEKCAEEYLGGGELRLLEDGLEFEKKEKKIVMGFANTARVYVEQMAVRMLTIQLREALGNPPRKEYRFMVKKPDEWEKAINDQKTAYEESSASGVNV